MPDEETTSSTLLMRLQSTEDQASWAEFCELYTPLLVRWIKRSGIPESDVPDLVQIVLMSLQHSLPAFNYQRGLGGGFRGYLRKVIKSKIADYWVAKQRRPPHTSLIEDADATYDDPQEQAWNHEYNQHFLSAALNHVRPTVDPETWEIFRLSTSEGKSANELGEMFGITPGAVDSRVWRVVEKIRDYVKRIDPEAWPEI